MKVRWSLSRKVLLVALLNFLLLALLVTAIARFQFGLQAESFLLGPVRDRITALGNNFSMEYETTAPDGREKLVASWSRQIVAEVYVTTPRGEWISGSAVELPPQVIDQMRRIVPPPQAGPPEQRPAPPPQAGPREQQPSPQSSSNPPEQRPSPPSNSNLPEQRSAPPPQAGSPEQRFSPPSVSNPPEQRPSPAANSNPPEQRLAPPPQAGPREQRPSPPSNSNLPEQRSARPPQAGSPEQRFSPPSVSNPPEQRPSPAANSNPPEQRSAPLPQAGPPEQRPGPPPQDGPPELRLGPPPRNRPGGPPPGREGPSGEGRPPREDQPPPREGQSPRQDPPEPRADPPPRKNPPQRKVPPVRREDPPPVADSQAPRPQMPVDSVFLVITHNPKYYWAGVRIPLRSLGGERTRPGILLFRSTSLFNRNLFFDWRLWVGVVLSVIAISVLCWLPFLRGLTRSIAGMDRATKEMAQGNFDIQVAHRRQDELGDLGEQIDRLGARLGGFVKNQKRFLGDIAHELCAPISRIQFALGILEQKAGESLRPHVAVLHEEVQEMSGLVNELLQFSKAGLESRIAPLTLVDVASVVRRAASREPSPTAFEISVPPGLAAMAHEEYLLRALANLLRNAVRYAGSSGAIAVTARRDKQQVEIVVADRGPGLPEGELEQVFAPFYRPEASRTRETGGAGLGLAIVKTCVEGCGGTVSARNRESGGLEVTVRLAAS